MPVEQETYDELARQAAGQGFRTSARDYSRIENRLRALRASLGNVRGIDVTAHEPASTFAPLPDETDAAR